MSYALLQPLAMRKEPDDAPLLLFVTCSQTGFETVVLTPSLSRVGDVVYRSSFLTAQHQSLATALQAWSEKKTQLIASGYPVELIAPGALPSAGPYADARILSLEEARALEDLRRNATALGAVVDPRKARVAEQKERAVERVRVAQIGGFEYALDDRAAVWSESGAPTIRITKAGGAVESTAEDAELAAGARQALARRVAHELGGVFDVAGFADDDVFVIESDVIDERLAARIERARPTVLRRPRLFGSRDERLTALRDILTAEGPGRLRVRSAHPEATYYADLHLDRALLEKIVPHLPSALQETLAHVRTEPVALFERAQSPPTPE